MESDSGLRTVDGANTKSTTFLRDTGGSITTGNLGVETSRITSEEMQETNSGSALKQRLSFRWPLLIQGMAETMQAQFSAGSNIRVEGIEALLNDDGSPKSLKIGLISTDNAEVQRAVNEAVRFEVEAAMAGTAANRDVQLKRLEVQSQSVGFAADVAKTAIPLIKALAGVP